MIVRPRPTLFQLFFILRGSVVPRIAPQILLIGVVSVAVEEFYQLRPNLMPPLNPSPFTLLGLALSIFLGFRNNACYDRWWEARRQWGELVFAARAFARQTLLLEGAAGPEPGGERRRLVTLAMAFTQALVLHLRPGGDDAKVTRHLGAEALRRYRASPNPPDALMQIMAGDLARLHAERRIGDIPYQLLDHTLGQMAMVQAACERIRNTPVPYAYTLLLHRTAYLFCFLLPFGYASTLGWATPFATALVTYTFFALDALGDELEEPFGTLPNDLPIGALADTIEINLRDALGETDLPPLPVPRDFLLM